MNSRKVLLSFLASFAITASLPAEEIFSDNFALDKPGREAGSSLDGLPVQTENAVWTANPAFTFVTENGSGYIHLSLDMSAGLGVPFSFAEMEDKGQVATVSVAVDLTCAKWVAISFGSKVAIDNFLPTTKLWVLLWTNGRWQVRDGFISDTESTILAEGDIVLPLDELAKLSVSYNESSETLVNFGINGVSVASDITFESMRKWPVKAITIFAYGGKEGLKIDDFKTSVTRVGDPLPQP